MTQSDRPHDEPLEELAASEASSEAQAELEHAELEQGGRDSVEAPVKATSGAPRGKMAPVIESESNEMPERRWYILKVQVNRENSICDALRRRVKLEGLDDYFGEILVPTEDVREFTKSGKQKIVKRRLYPGYIVVHMSINDDTWFAVRDTPGIGDFTGAAGKPSPLSDAEVAKILQLAKIGQPKTQEQPEIKTAIRFKPGDKVRVKEGYFQNFEGDVGTIDESNGRVTVMISIFGRHTPVELDHWQVEEV